MYGIDVTVDPFFTVDKFIRIKHYINTTETENPTYDINNTDYIDFRIRSVTETYVLIDFVKAYPNNDYEVSLPETSETIGWRMYRMPATEVALIGDANFDGTVNILDIVAITNHILMWQWNPNAVLSTTQLQIADGQVNILDIVSMVHLILGIE